MEKKGDNSKIRKYRVISWKSSGNEIVLVTLIIPENIILLCLLAKRKESGKIGGKRFMSYKTAYNQYALSTNASMLGCLENRGDPIHSDYI